MQVLRTGLAALAEPDPVEPGKPVVVTSQDAEVLNDASLVSEDVGIRWPSMAEQTDLYPLARLQAGYTPMAMDSSAIETNFPLPADPRLDGPEAVLRAEPLHRHRCTTQGRGARPKEGHRR